MIAIAHIQQKKDGSWEEPHALENHLESVGKLSQEFAGSFNNSDWGLLAGRWHDLGKYKPAFQMYIRTVSGYDICVEQAGHRSKIDHSIVGALRAKEYFGQGGALYAKVFAYLIAGHHAGLPDWNNEPGIGGALSSRLLEESHLAEALSGNPSKELLEGFIPETMYAGEVEHLHLWIRMLFSCLVDADFLDTESYMDKDQQAARNSFVKTDMGELKRQFDDYMRVLASGSAQTPVNGLRQEILDQCRANAQWKPGVFSLSVPTGGGKTLSGMAFAIEHCIKYGKRRIIVAIPYTSIIEQTANQYRKIFGKDAVLEHHCNLDPEKETERSRLASENWDAPIIVTTNVQLFESLFAARTSQCRKIHNMANSVIILDEAQMLPPSYLEPIVSAMKGLCATFGCSVVLSTATQPAIDGRFQSGMAVLHGFSEGSVRELMDNPEELSRRLRRVEIIRREINNARSTWQEIANELRSESQVLCIVNTRKDCRELFDLMPSGTIHLSALMCPEHRSEVIQKIKKALRNKEQIRVISTQLVEAGVDFDFPVVYRALAGFDSIAQAAGRCNREGKLNEIGKLGRTVVFRPLKDAPAGPLRKGQDTGDEILRTFSELASTLDPKVFTQYFKLFYSKVNSFDEKEIMTLLNGPDASEIKIQFRTAAERFHLIENAGQVPVIVWYSKDHTDDYCAVSGEGLVRELERNGPYRALMRRIQRYTVTIPERLARELEKEGMLRQVINMDQLYTQTNIVCQGSQKNLYDSVFGLDLDGAMLGIDDFIA